jgi:hypothetical protein
MTAEIELEGHRLVAVCPDDLNAPAQSMLAKFAELHARGPALHPGSVIDFGWAPLRIEAMGEVWFACEPDFAHDGRNFVPSVAVTLRVLDEQARVIKLARAQPHATRYDETVRIDKRAWDAPRVMVTRLPTKTAKDSGWYVMPDETEASPHPDEQSMTAGKLAIVRPAWTKVFALPPKYLTIFEGDRLLEVYDEESRQVGSFREGGDV